MNTITATLSESDLQQRHPRDAEPSRYQTPRDTTRVLVVDDHPAVRWGLVQLLDEQPDLAVVAVAETAQAALAQAERERVDVAVVDYHLGGRNGLWLTRRLKALDGPPRAVVFSAFANDHLAANCVVADADALLSKGSLGDELCHAIRSVARGRRLIPRIAQPMGDLLRSRLESDRELMIFGMLLAGIRGEVVAERLGIDMRELAEQRSRMLAKLEPLPGEVAIPRVGHAPLDYERPISR